MKIELNKTRVIDCRHPIRPIARAALVFRFNIYRSVRTQALSWQGERSQIYRMRSIPETPKFVLWRSTLCYKKYKQQSFHHKYIFVPAINFNKASQPLLL